MCSLRSSLYNAFCVFNVPPFCGRCSELVRKTALPIDLASIDLPDAATYPSNISDRTCIKGEKSSRNKREPFMRQHKTYTRWLGNRASLYTHVSFNNSSPVCSPLHTAPHLWHLGPINTAATVCCPDRAAAACRVLRGPETSQHFFSCSLSCAEKRVQLQAWAFLS